MAAVVEQGEPAQAVGHEDAAARHGQGWQLRRAGAADAGCPQGAARPELEGLGRQIVVDGDNKGAAPGGVRNGRSADAAGSERHRPPFPARRHVDGGCTRPRAFGGLPGCDGRAAVGGRRALGPPAQVDAPRHGARVDVDSDEAAAVGAREHEAAGEHGR